VPIPFQRCTRALDSERDTRSAIALAFVVVFVGAAVAWSMLARVTIFETTDAARIETVPGVHIIQTQVAGRLVATHIALDQEVREGAVLVELDAQNEILELDEERAKLASLTEQLVALRSERDSLARALVEHRSETPAALREAESRRSESEVTAAFAEGERLRVLRLHDAGAVSEFDMARARAEALERRAAADALGSAAVRLRSEKSALLSERVSAIARLEREDARIAGDVATTTANVQRLEHAVSLRTIRAPVSGRLAQINDLQIGAVLQEATRIGAIVPRGELRVVAKFPAAASLGRLHPGQPAWLRLEGFPWTEYGKTEATVVHVGNEEVEGKIRVELAVNRATAPPHIEHGLAATVEVAVDRIAPASLLVRVATRRLTGVIGADPAQPSDAASR